MPSQPPIGLPPHDDRGGIPPALLMFGLPAPVDQLRAALLAARQHMLWAALFSALLNLLFLAPTIYMLQIYDRVVPTKGGPTLLFLTLVLVLALGTLALLDLIRSRLMVRASIRLDRQLAGAIIQTQIAPPSGASEARIRNATRDLDLLRQVLTGPAVVALFDAPWSPIYILVCLLIHPWLGLFALVATVIVLAIAWANERATHIPLGRAAEVAKISYLSQEQTVASGEAIRALGMREAMVRRHIEERDSVTALQAEAGFAGGRYVAAGRFLRLVLQSLALGLGALLAIDNQISGGAIFASAFLVGRALAPVDHLTGGWRSIVQARGAYENLNALLAPGSERIVPTQLPRPQGRIDIEHLFVLNPEKDGAILADISLSLARGEIIAIVGPSGAGKSTLLRAIAGAILPDRGRIRFDGVDRADWEQDRLGQAIGYLPQEPSLLAGTIKENISRFASDGPKVDVDSAVVAAARRCGAHDMILRLQNGYDARLAWNGRGLSAGQAQRIALARALYGDPAILLLDEPNAHLDSEGEAQLIETLRQFKEEGGSAFLVAHRMGVMGIVDKIVVLESGKVEAFGARDQVLSRLQGNAPKPVTSLRVKRS